jgi:cell division protein FtsZ
MTDMILERQQSAVIKVIGVGGCGNNAVNRMIKDGIVGVHFIGINTDAQALRACNAETRIPIGQKIYKGLGVGGIPEKGKQAAEESEEQIRYAISGADMVIITTGMGGGTGTGAAPIIAKIAKEENCLTIGVVTTPFKFELGRDQIAQEGIENLKPYVDSLIVIPNERVFSMKTLNMISIEDMYKVIDGALRGSVQAITDVITLRGEINMDFNDVKEILKDSQTALIGTGECSAEADWKEAVDMAMKNPMLDDYDIAKSKKILIFAVTNRNQPAIKLKALFESIDKSYGSIRSKDRRTYFGHAYKEHLDNKVRVALIGTGNIRNKRAAKEIIPIPTPTVKDAKINKTQGVNEADKGKIDFSKPAFRIWHQSGRLDKK